MRKKHPIAFLICLGYFSQTASYLIIAGCSKDHDNSRETEIPTTVPTTIHPAFIDPNERKLAIARKEETTSAEPAKGVEAATTIQQALRRHQATQKLRQVKETVTKVQALVRGALAREVMAKQKIEAKKAARTEAEEAIAAEVADAATESDIAATTIQAIRRGCNVREQVEAATTIQKVRRGYNTRKKIPKEKTAEEAIAVEAAVANAVTESNNTATTIQKAERDNNLRTEEQTNGDTSGAKEMLKGSGTLHTSDLSDDGDDESDTNSMNGDHTQTTYLSFDEETIAQNKIFQTPERRIRGRKYSTISITEVDPSSIVGQRIIRDTALSLLNSSPEVLGTINDVTPDRARISGHQALARSASKKGYGNIEDEAEYEDDNWSTDYSSNSSDNAEKESGASTKIDAKSCLKSKTDPLDSATMRWYIATRLPEFKEAEVTFSTDGVEQPIFLYKEDVGYSGEKIYIAFAHNREPDDVRVQTSGERSLSIVLNDIKEDIEKNLKSKTGNNKAPIKLLIPLQQIRKKHWVLLEIYISSLTASSVTVTHYDSRGRVSLSCVEDFWASNTKERIQKWVQATFTDVKTVDLKFKYDRAQKMSDKHNCDRHTLIKLHSLLAPGARRPSLRDINRSLNGEEQPHAQALIRKKKGTKRRLSSGVERRIFRKMSNSQENGSSSLSRESSASKDWETIEE